MLLYNIFADILYAPKHIFNRYPWKYIDINDIRVSNLVWNDVYDMEVVLDLLSKVMGARIIIDANQFNPSPDLKLAMKHIRSNYRHWLREPHTDIMLNAVGWDFSTKADIIVQARIDAMNNIVITETLLDQLAQYIDMHVTNL